MKKPTRIKLTIVLGVLVLVLLVVQRVIPMLVDLNRYQQFIVSEIEGSLGGKATIGPISWGISDHIWLEVSGLTVRNATALPVDINLSYIRADISLHPLLDKRVVLKKLQLQGPEIKVRLQEASNRPESAPKHRTTIALADLPFNVEIDELSVNLERLVLVDTLSIPGHPQTHVLSESAFSAKLNVPGETLAFDFTMQDNSSSGLGALNVQASLRGLTKALVIDDPDITLQATLRNMSVDPVKPYLNNSLLSDRLDGHLSLDINVQGKLSNNLQLKGLLDLGGVAYTDLSRWEAVIPGQKTSLAFGASLNSENLNLENISLKTGQLSLEAKAKVLNWNKTPLITETEISSDLPLLEIIRFVPWLKLENEAELLRSILLGGGKLVVNRLVLPEFNPAELAANIEDLLAGIDMQAEVSGVTIKPSPDMPKIEEIAGRISLKDNALLAEDLKSTLGSIALPAANIRIADIRVKPKISIRLKGPQDLAISRDAHINKWLMNHGLKNLAGLVDIDILADIDLRHPRDWTANGSLVLQDVHTVTHPDEIGIQNLRGSLKFTWDKSISLFATKLRASIAEAGVEVSGKIVDIGTPHMLISSRLDARQLDLSLSQKFFPALAGMNMGGELDLNLDMHIPYHRLKSSKLTGTLATRNMGFHLASGLTVEKVNTRIKLEGDSADINTMSLSVNDQLWSISGRLSNPENPTATLSLTSTELELDRLLPQNKFKDVPLKAVMPGTEIELNRVPDPVESPLTKKPQWPLPRLTANLEINVGQGSYREAKFQNMGLKVRYRHREIEHFELRFAVDKGLVVAIGSADLSAPEQIAFELNPDISDLPMESVAQALDLAPPLTGPMSLSGQLLGHIGSKQALLASLTGTLKARIGSGTLTRIGKAGGLVLDILSATSVRGILSGDLIENMNREGQPFREITARAQLGEGTLTLENIDLKSEAILMNSQGTINLINEQLDLDVEVEPLRGVAKVIGSVPLIGEAVEHLVAIQLEVSGTFATPEIKPGKVKRFENMLRTDIGHAEEFADDLAD